MSHLVKVRTMRWMIRWCYWLSFGIILVGMLTIAWGSLAWGATYLLQDLGGFLPEDVNRMGAMAGTWCDGVTSCRPARHDGTHLDVLDERPGSAWAINGRGEVVAEVFDEDGPHPLFCPADGPCTELSLGESFWTQGTPLNVNDAGHIVGVLRIRGSTGACPARWESPTVEPVCFTPFASNAGLDALNQQGVVAGFWQQDEFGEDLTFRWSETTGIVPLPLGSPQSLNAAGWIVYEDNILVSPMGTIVPLGDPRGCGNTRGHDINDLRLVHGESDCADGTRAWVWHQGSGFIDLTAAVHDATYVIRVAKGLNDLGQVVAWAEHVPTSLFRGVLLTPAKVAKLLERLGR